MIPKYSFNLKYVGSPSSVDYKNVYADFANAYGGRYVDGTYSPLLSVAVFCALLKQFE